MADYKVPIITGSSLTAGDLLRWDGSDWVNYADSAYAGAGANELIGITHDCGTSDISLDEDISFGGGDSGG